MQHDQDEIFISSITYAELMYGVNKSQAIARNQLALSLFLSPITILDFDSLAAQEYGYIRATLESLGTPIDPMNTLIAAHAKSSGLVIVTNNVKEFSRVAGLDIENWAE